MQRFLSKTSIALAIAAAAAIAGASALMSGGDAARDGAIGGAPPPSASSSKKHGSSLPALPTQRYIVVYREAPLSTYDGELKGLPAPQRLSAAASLAGSDSAPPARIDVHGRAARNYLDHLGQVQFDHERKINSAIGRPLRIEHRMGHALNAVITRMSLSEAARVSKLPQVRLVEPYREYAQATDAGPGLIGAPALWNATPTAYRGEGVVVGILDSGINFGSPSFAAVDASGYRHVNPLGAGVYLGTCKAGGVDEGRCNDKLIGGYDFVCGEPGNACGDATKREEPGFGDTNSHGSHVASTAAGNARSVTLRGNTFAISGVAPHANIVAYDVCYSSLPDGGGLCPNTSAARAVDQAIADGVVDVLNYSIAGGEAPWGESVSLAFLNAVEAGIYVAAAAGNDGPGANTADHLEPWVGTTAAAQHGRGAIQPVLRITGPGTVPAALQKLLVQEGVNGTPLPGPMPTNTPIKISAGIDTANDGCAAFPAGTFQGAIAVIRRGTCNFSVKINFAADAGATAVIIANNQTAFGLNHAGARIPGFMASQADSNALRDFAAGNGNATTGGVDGWVSVPNTPDVLADFSSRGPGGGLDQIKPDITAPGVDILGVIAGTTITGSESAVGLLSGTSMASPHHAGAAALIRQARPSWTPSEIKSALMMTAKQAVLKEDGVTQADPHAMGAGRIQVDQAIRAGLVLDETIANYRAANPAAGGDVSTLNLPSMGKTSCYNSCSFTRTFRNTQNTAQSWSAKIEGGLNAVVTPAVFTLGPGETRSLKVTVINSGAVADSVWRFGKLALTATTRNTDQPVLRLPIGVTTTPAVLRLNPAQLALSLPAGSQGSVSFRIDNTGGSALDYQVDNTGNGTRALVANPATALGQGNFSSFLLPILGIFMADDFAISELTGIQQLRADGFVLDGSALASTATAVTWSIYADNNGAPVGHPLLAAKPPVWRHESAPGSPGLTFNGRTVSLDLAAAGQNLQLPAGRYWLVVAPRVPSPQKGWAWLFSDAGAGGYRYIEADASTAADWESRNDFPALAFGVRSSHACGRPWIGAPNRAFGRVLPATGFNTVVQINTAGLAVGEHVGYVCVSGNDPVAPKQALRVALTITPATGR